MHPSVLSHLHLFLFLFGFPPVLASFLLKKADCFGSCREGPASGLEPSGSRKKGSEQQRCGQGSELSTKGSAPFCLLSGLLIPSLHLTDRDISCRCDIL